VFTKANTDTASLSKLPATPLDMHAQFTDKNRAANRPTSGRFVASLPRRYIDIHYITENTGAVKTQIFLISKGNDKISRIHF